MAVSLASSMLFMNAIEKANFTGWPDWQGMDDGSYSSMMMLSANGVHYRYSIIARTNDPDNGPYMFILCVDQVDKRLSHLSNKFPIRSAALIERESKYRLGIEIDYGENIVLDVVDRPALKFRDSQPVDDYHEEPDDGYDDGEDDPGDDEDYDDYDEDSGSRLGNVIGAIRDKASKAKLTKERNRRAMEDMPARDKTRIGHHGGPRI